VATDNNDRSIQFRTMAIDG